MRQSADRAVELMKVLGNPERMMLVCQIAQGERNVGELESELGIRQPTLSQQLAVLRRADVVETRREGKQIYYRVSSPEALRVIETLYALYCLPDGAACEPKVEA
ncbi:helix-turn-helix transcriptional regulator [Chitinimonas sp. BJYL2]|uniref:ArsR/SmtB family transcription factor n=1 Tax=Chitinimonas sp. BJYL2 TaxID=2976696 RepID=UPI0022B39114|nr:metalloregulator ArsR/SmtB family transcription factor [Chitinimonas sp. BJYL2]